MEQQKKWIITGKGEVPYNIHNWLNDYGINDFKLSYSHFTFKGTNQQLDDIMNQLIKNERYFKVIGIESVD
jgi:hypothetical protein